MTDHLLFYHPESDSFVEVEPTDLEAFRQSQDGALCNEITDVAVPTTTPTVTLVVKAKTFADVHDQEQALIAAPAITDQPTMNKVRAIVKSAKKLWNDIEAARQLAKAPFLDACQRIDAAARPLLGRLTDVMNEGKHQEGTWLIERDRQLREDEDRRRAAELEALKDTSRPTAPLVAPTLPAVLDAPLAQFKEVTIVDPALVPDEYWVIDMAKLEKAALAAAAAGKAIPGVTVTTVSRVVAR